MPLEHEDRRSFFNDMVAWGQVTENTRLIFVGIEDGGESWTERHQETALDQEITKCRCAADNKTVHGRYIIPGGAADFKVTEQRQCELAIKLRNVMAIPFPDLTDKRAYYQATFQNGFELCANIYPFARPTTSHKYPQSLLNYLDFSTQDEIKQWIKDGLDHRLNGIVRLRDGILKRVTEPIVMHFMGLPHLWPEIIKVLSLKPDIVKQPPLKLRRDNQLIMSTECIYCFTRHPSHGHFTNGDVNILSEALKTLIDQQSSGDRHE